MESVSHNYSFIGKPSFAVWKFLLCIGVGREISLTNVAAGDSPK